jgi:hypothetical protein
MASNTMGIRISLIVFLILELGCSNAARLQEDVQISPEELLTGAYSLPTDEPPSIIDRTDVLSLSPEMRKTPAGGCPGPKKSPHPMS